ncbi:MAG: glycosyltransferase family 4 protein [Bacteroidetes bacterium]|nr:glycosyltransferase family 4 protein [Bacteroidota bacterium]
MPSQTIPGRGVGPSGPPGSDCPPKVLICSVDLEGHGGVAEYCLALRESLAVPAEFFTVGRRPHQQERLLAPLRALWDAFRFVRVLTRGKFDLVHLNPSLNFKAVARDALLLVIAKAAGARVLVFFHGWDASFRQLITRRFRRIFCALFSRADGIVVLSSEFKADLRALGLQNPVYVETTAVRNEVFHFLAQCGIESRETNEDAGFEILFLSRVERYKGIRETVEAYRLLRSRSDRVRLTIAGVGQDLEGIKRYVREQGIEGVTFAGHLVGESKGRAFLQSSVYVLPSYSEGMPISVLEAMAYGVPVVANRTGGLRDFFEHGKMGFLADRPEPELLSDLIGNLLQDRELARRISAYNHQYAKTRFAASTVARRLEQIYYEVGCQQ